MEKERIEQEKEKRNFLKKFKLSYFVIDIKVLKFSLRFKF